MARINVVSDRDRLAKRRHPYFISLGSGRHLGFRKMSIVGTWIAMYRDSSNGKRSTHALGDFEELKPSERFDAAKEAAEAWFKLIGAGIEKTDLTIRDLCDEYAQYILTHKGELASKDVSRRFKQYVLDDQKFANTELSKIRRRQIEDWRKKLSNTPITVQRKLKAGESPSPPKFRTSSSLNRDMTCLRAALNWALEKNWISDDRPWKVPLKPIPNADRQRQVKISRADVELLIDKAQPEIVPLLRSLTYLPLRPGAMASLIVSDFNQSNSVLTINKDKGHAARNLTLPPEVSAFMKSQALGKSPTDPLIGRLNGNHWDKDTWKDPVKEAVIAAGLPNDESIYSLRHIAITTLVQSGADLLSVAQVSGTSLRMIEKNYGHLTPRHSENVLSLLTAK
jgi:site-specific recombinase XerD